MKQSKEKRMRKCKRCPNVYYGDAEKMKQHEAEHKVVDRAKAAGLVLPKSTEVKGSVLI